MRGLNLVQVSFVLASQFLLKYLSLTAARWLHNSMLKQLLRWVQALCCRHAVNILVIVLTCGPHADSERRACISIGPYAL